ncbi:hypothetical protein RND71_005243 [Anisodus tanguticus]|uniref:Uncharacterized protein n=1 Tax=Anisodus tanguticus TaxID=243964 RepID=A0AAE1SRR9_9SOLA|nr:hypothetical protein RND71_005243 [Anisodus tanguticus]
MKLESMNLNSCQQIPMKEPEFLFDSISKLIVSKGETQEKACEELWERLQVLEEGTKNNFTEGNRKIHGEDPDVLDIMLVATLYASRLKKRSLA